MIHNSLLAPYPDLFAMAGHLLQAAERGAFLEIADEAGAAPVDWVARIAAPRRHVRMSPDQLVSAMTGGLDPKDLVFLLAENSAGARDNEPALPMLKELTSAGALGLLACSNGGPGTCFLAEDAELPVVFEGRTSPENFLRERTARVLVLDAALAEARRATAAAVLSPLAVVSTFNDADVIGSLSRHHLQGGLDLHFVDNWSDDGTFETLEALASEHPGRVRLERFPAGGPTNQYRWVDILNRKAEIGRMHPGRWILHVDSDELRLAPWADATIAEALAAAQRWGATVVNFSVFNFAPTRDGFSAADDPLEFFDRFELPHSPPHFNQRRAWLQGESLVDLASSGGHRAKFPEARVFPYNFPLLHYSIRSTEQGRRKVFRDRKPRLSEEERRERGWHYHYDSFQDDERFLKLPELLTRFDAATFREEHLVEVLSDAGRRRLAGSLVR